MPEDQVLRRLPIILAGEPPATPKNRFKAIKDVDLSQAQINALFVPDFYTPDDTTPGALTADDLIAHLGGLDNALESHLDEWGPPVADFPALRAVAPADRTDRQLRYVEDATNPGIYAFDAEGVGADDGLLIIVPDVGTGRWFRRSGGGMSPSPHAPTHDAETGSDPLGTAAAGAVAIGDSAAEGTAETFARSDHQHSLAAPAAPANVTKAAAGAGSAVEPARADHKHDISTAAPTGIGTSNAEGSATSMARSDHVHDHGAQTTATHHAAATGSVNGFMSSADKAKLDNIVLARLQLFADQLDIPNNADWAVNAIAPSVADSNDNNKTVAAFDDTTEEGRGFPARIPVGATNIVLKLVSRAETAPGAARTVGLKLYTQDNPDNAAPTAWDAGTVLTDIDIPTNENFQYDSQTITLASLGLTAGEIVHFELTRVNPTGGVELVGDWNLLELEVDFT